MLWCIFFHKNQSFCLRLFAEILEKQFKLKVIEIEEISIASTAFWQRNAIATAIWNIYIKKYIIIHKNCCFGVYHFVFTQKNFYCFMSILHCVILPINPFGQIFGICIEKKTLIGVRSPWVEPQLLTLRYVSTSMI